MSASMRYALEPDTLRDPSGAIRISDRVYRGRQGRRMVFMGLLFFGLVAGLSSQGDGGYFHDFFASESIPLVVVGFLFLLFTVLTTFMGVMQLASRLVLTVNADTTEVLFEQTSFGRQVLSAEVPVEELEPEVREAILELVAVLRLVAPEELDGPGSEPLYSGPMALQIKVLEGGSVKKMAHLTPEKDFVSIHTSIHPEAIVLNGSYGSMRLEGLGVWIPAIPPREIHHVQDIRAIMDSGLLSDWKITRKGFELTFMPSAAILSDFPKAKEVIITLQPTEEETARIEQALADFKKAGQTRKGSTEHVILALGRRPISPEPTPSTTIDTPEQGHA
jgi:hypothetical protein